MYGLDWVRPVVSTLAGFGAAAVDTGGGCVCVQVGAARPWELLVTPDDPDRGSVWGPGGSSGWLWTCDADGSEGSVWSLVGDWWETAGLLVWLRDQIATVVRERLLNA